VPAEPGPPGKMAVKMYRDREKERKTVSKMPFPSSCHPTNTLKEQANKQIKTIINKQ